MATAAGTVELSLTLTDDAVIRDMNAEYRGVDAATDVLSFEMGSDEDDGDGGIQHVQLPVHALGDVIISLDTAARQADERKHGVRSELRILLVHGLLHLLGFDHEQEREGADVMTKLETEVLQALGWEAQGLIAHAHAAATASSEQEHALPSTSGPSLSGAAQHPRRRRDVRLVALDMDGTLLDGRSAVLPSSAEAIRAALAHGVHVVLATGKARPAALVALKRAGLEDLASDASPGIFLQGLLVYGLGGRLLSSAALPPSVVRAAFEYSEAHDVPLAAFLGDDCITTRMSPELEELHVRYHEPLPRIVPSPAAAAEDHLVRKLLFMTHPARIEGVVKTHWEATLAGSEAETMQALPNMLEIVPRGWNKWTALQHLLADLKLESQQLMAVGDGGNDLAMVRGAGVGVAMGNAVPQVLQAADLVVPDNNAGGVAAALELVLDL